MKINNQNYNVFSCIKKRVFIVQRMCGEKNKYAYFDIPLSISRTNFKDNFGSSAMELIKRK